MTAKTKVIIGTTIVVIAFAAGRYSTPEKVKIETKTVVVEKEVEKKKTKKHKDTVVVETTAPDGSKVKTTHITTDTQAGTVIADVKSDTNTQLTEKVKESSKTSISALFGVNVLSPSNLNYGVHISRPVLGPMSLGAYGFSDGKVGLSVGVSF